MKKKLKMMIIFFFTIYISSYAQDNLNISNLLNMSLDEILNLKIVSASKFEESLSETPATIMVITHQDIEERGYTTLSEIFQDLPGMDVIVSDGDVYQLIYMRGNRTGAFNERTLLLINGVEMNILFSQHMNIDSDFPLSAIERIEILFGPAAAVYGPNAFSVINIITKSPKNLTKNGIKINSNIGGGSFDTKYGEVTVLGKNGPLGLSFSYRRYRSDRSDMTDRTGYFKDDGIIIGNKKLWGPYADLYPEWNNSSNNFGLLTKITFHDFELNYYQLETRQGNGAVYPYDKTLPIDNWHFIRKNLNLHYTKKIDPNLSINFLTSYQHGGVSPDSPWASGWHTSDTTRSVIMQTWKFMCSKWALFQDIIYQSQEHITINGGIKYATGTYQKSYEHGNADQINFSYSDTEYQYNNLFPEVLPENGITPGNSFTDSEWGVFGQLKFSLIKKRFNFVIGSRYDDNSIYGNSFNPRIGFTWQINESISIKSNYGTAFQAPAPRNLYAAWGGLNVNENLKPDKIKSFEFNAILVNKLFTNEITLFSNKITNSIMQGENLPDKNIFGLENKFTFVLQDISNIINNAELHANFTWIKARYSQNRYNADSSRSSDKIGDIASIKFNIIFNAQIMKRLLSNIKLNYVGERPTTITNPIETVDGYFVVNAGLQIKNFPFKNMTLYFNGYNILNKDYYHPGYDTADAGENFWQINDGNYHYEPSLGWYSSRMPQRRRYFMIGLKTSF